MFPKGSWLAENSLYYTSEVPPLDLVVSSGRNLGRAVSPAKMKHLTYAIHCLQECNAPFIIVASYAELK
jgi:hypothetical protein